MNIYNAYLLKEAAIKDAILDSLSDGQIDQLRTTIEQAFELGAQHWENEVLPRAMGAASAKNLLNEVKNARDN
ncbi:hypothetical protein ACC755_09795 [Rhizobium ruizarguesonis]|uniref:hypothetical protein n=1 Tax=Rhizobium ruizarguesonis TaxID=2081791 RepID=UPI00103133ED|nr:hypothetical protein [Rhizobium ruizarguesonis]TAY84524.1 hypothetical protein ELH85_32375 [Rhizobium ruizarguesonis]